MTIVAQSERMHASGGAIEGGSPLAGHLGLASLLVRECVQNAWDARDDLREGPVHFSIDGWDLDTDQLAHLRSLLPVKDLRGFVRQADQDAPGRTLHPASVLERPSVQVLVVSDRRTVGLCGPSRSGTSWTPVRNGRPLDRGQQRFANFVRNQGRATVNTGAGDGGAYGVGKSVLWMASLCGTVLIHTRTTDEAGLPVERFIGKVHGDYFEYGGFEYSGRHFLGEVVDDVVEPLVGAYAAAARRGLPIPSYEIDGDAVDGTSVVIVAPRLPLDWTTEMELIRDAVRWQVWPKRVPGVRAPDGEPDMYVDLRWNNHPVDLPMPLEDPEIRPYAKTLLDCARDRNADDPNRDHVARCGRPKKDLGVLKFRSAGEPDSNVFHLTLTDEELDERATSAGVEDADHEAVVGFGRPWGQIALIRREPLLLVRYEAIGGPDAAATEVGVFLSADDDEVENALTKAEPPAHDEWNHLIVPKDHPRDHRRTFAKRTVDEIKSARKKLLTTFRSGDVGDEGGGEQAVSRRISEGVFGGLGGGGRPAPKPKGNTAPKIGPRATLEHLRSRQHGDRTIHELAVSLSGLADEADVVLVAGGAGYDNSGRMEVEEFVSYQWADSSGNLTAGPSTILRGSDGTKVSLLISIDTGLRFRPKVTVEVGNGA